MSQEPAEESQEAKEQAPATSGAPLEGGGLRGAVPADDEVRDKITHSIAITACQIRGVCTGLKDEAQDVAQGTGWDGVFEQFEPLRSELTNSHNAPLFTHFLVSYRSKLSPEPTTT